MQPTLTLGNTNVPTILLAKKDADLAARLMEEHLSFVEQSLSFHKKTPTHDIALALS